MLIKVIALNLLMLFLIPLIISYKRNRDLFSSEVHKIKTRIHLHYFNKLLLKEIITYSFFVFITMIVDQIFWKLGQTILGVILDTAAVAVYAFAMQFVIYYMLVSTAISWVFLPRVTQMVVKNISGKKLTNMLIGIGRIQFITLFAASSIVFVER
jgi:O-antigen/teichoic acid export membrane protein